MAQNKHHFIDSLAHRFTWECPSIEPQIHHFVDCKFCWWWTGPINQTDRSKCACSKKKIQVIFTVQTGVRLRTMLIIFGMFKSYYFWRVIDSMTLNKLLNWIAGSVRLKNSQFTIFNPKNVIRSNRLPSFIWIISFIVRSTLFQRKLKLKQQQRHDETWNL